MKTSGEPTAKAKKKAVVEEEKVDPARVQPPPPATRSSIPPPACFAVPMSMPFHHFQLTTRASQQLPQGQGFGSWARVPQPYPFAVGAGYPWYS